MGGFRIAGNNVGIAMGDGRAWAPSISFAIAQFFFAKLNIGSVIAAYTSGLARLGALEFFHPRRPEALLFAAHLV
jgi:hypothetical protein